MTFSNHCKMNWPDYGPSLSEHAILVANLDPNLKAATDMDTSEGLPPLICSDTKVI
jgi:hypothetical protein